MSNRKQKKTILFKITGRFQGPKQDVERNIPSRREAESLLREYQEAGWQSLKAQAQSYKKNSQIG